MRDLFSHGAVPHDQAIHWAVRRIASDPDRLDMISLLHSQGVDMDSLGSGHEDQPWQRGRWRPRNRCTALFHAAYEGDLGMVRFLIELGADVYIRNTTERRDGIEVATLDGLDAMRQSRCVHVRELAHEMFGPDTRSKARRRHEVMKPFLPGKVTKEEMQRAKKAPRTRKRAPKQEKRSMLQQPQKRKRNTSRYSLRAVPS